MNIETIVEKWSNLKTSESEGNLNAKFTNHLWSILGYHFNVSPSIAPGMKPDYVLYDEKNLPLLVVETKKRITNLAAQNEPDFSQACKQDLLYKQAWGDSSLVGNNGIVQYLSVKNNPAKYGLIFNGDFWQLFRKVDGLIIPLTEVQKVTAETLPRLIKQLQHYLQNSNKAFVVSMWNRKGGVAKTTNTINIAAVLSAMGKRVLVVDLDPQTDLTKSLGLNPEKYAGKLLDCLDSLQKEEAEATKIQLQDLIEQKGFSISKDHKYLIDILSGHKETLEKFAENEGDNAYQMTNKPTAIKRLLSYISQDYDYIFIDTSPKADMLTVCSLFAADGVIIPSDYDPETLRHACHINTDIIPKIRSQRGKKQSLIDDHFPRVLGLVFSNCPDMGVKLKKQVNDYLAQFSLNIYQIELRHYQATVLAKFNRKPVVFHSPKSEISKQYIALTKEIFFSNRLLSA
jgi:chromosome partitioning protein